MYLLGIGEQYILPRTIHIERSQIVTPEGNKAGTDVSLPSGTKVLIASVQDYKGRVCFTDGKYNYETTIAKLTGCIRYSHEGYDFFVQNGTCTVRDLRGHETIEEFLVDSNIETNEFQNICEERAKGYFRPHRPEGGFYDRSNHSLSAVFGKTNQVHTWKH